MRSALKLRGVVAGMVLVMAPLDASAQQPELRVVAGREVRVAGALLDGSPAFPAAALEALGADVRQDATGASAILFGDTLAFSTWSPFFLAGSHVHQLAFPVRPQAGELFFPEQLFIEWLPKRYPDRLAYTGGALRAQGAVAVERPRAERVVVLDPGHGGRDPGKIGPNGLREKEAALMISMALAERLRERGYEVHLTRTTDTLIALADRPRLANRWKNGRPRALFMSIHCNSVTSQTVRGFETFLLAEAQTEDERRVAEMENAVVELEDGPSVPDLPEVDRILNGLRNDFYLRASSDLAEVVQSQLASFHSGPNRGVKRAGFRVLVGAFMPAVLVEVAFISNPREARDLATENFRARVADALAVAVDRFFEGHEHLWAEGP